MISGFRLSDERIKREVMSILKEYLYHPESLKMKDFMQHGSVSTYDHSLSVAYRCYGMAYGRRGVDIRLLTVCAFLHDFYLYDWHERDRSHRWHGFHHAKRAAENAERIFSLGEKGKSIILSHMWPINLTRIPRSKEAWILTFADKIQSFSETFAGIFERRNR